ncbi:MAG: hypothetical protein AAGD25_31805 [Cyanobacteria bacterium P01_F01_bin.150]
MKREEKIHAGIDELDRWLQDLMRQGLASAQVQSYQFWDSMAARMVDAQAPGLARRLRDCAGIPHNSRREKDWPQRLLTALGKLRLLIQGYRRIDSLPFPLQAELRTQIGWTQKKSDIFALAEGKGNNDANYSTVTVQSDNWQVLGIRVLEEEKFWTQRVWLWGINSDRPALLLNYAYGRPNFNSMADSANDSALVNVDLVPGIILPAQLVFYPSSYPLRALVKQLTGMVKPLLDFSQSTTVTEALGQYGHAISQNPWLERMPLVLNGVRPCLADSNSSKPDAYVIDAYVIDAQNSTIAEKDNDVTTGLPIHPSFGNVWELLALSGGYPMAIAAEWDGSYLWPLCASVEGRLVIF